MLYALVIWVSLASSVWAISADTRTCAYWLAQLDEIERWERILWDARREDRDKWDLLDLDYEVRQRLIRIRAQIEQDVRQDP